MIANARKNSRNIEVQKIMVTKLHMKRSHIYELAQALTMQAWVHTRRLIIKAKLLEISSDTHQLRYIPKHNNHNSWHGT